MKKRISIILLTVLILALGLGIYYKLMLARPLIERMLPEGAVLFVHIREIEKSLKEFKASQLWQNVKKIDGELLLQKSGLAQEQLERYNKAKTEFSRWGTDLLLDKFFGQEMALAAYSNDTSTVSPPQALVDAASNIILVTRIKSEAQFIEFISKLYNKFGQKAKTTEEKYKDFQLTAVKLNDQLNLYYVKINDLLVISLGKASIINCLDVVAKNKPSLAEDKNYISAIAKLPARARMLVYGNFALLFAQSKQLIDTIAQDGKLPLEQKEEILKSLHQAQALKTLALAFCPGEISRYKTIITLDKTTMDPVLVKAYSVKPQKNNTINFIPKDIIAYQWSNCFDAKMSWDNLQQELAKRPKGLVQGPPPEEVISGIEEGLGMSVEKDVIAALGNEIGGFLADLNLSGPVPLPAILIFVKINNKATIEGAMANLAKKNNLTLVSEEYNKIGIKYISFLPAGDLRPAYCFLDEYLLIATSPKLLKNSINASNTPADCLLANPDFQAVNLGLSDKNNAICFLKTDLLLQKIKELTEWAVNWASLMAKNLQAYQQQQEEYLNQLEKAVQEVEAQAEKLKANLETLKKEISDLQSQGLDISSKQQEMTELENKSIEKEEEIAQAKKELAEKNEQLKNVIQKSPLRRMDLSLVKLCLQELFYPILDGLQQNKAMGSRTIFSQDIIETQTFSKAGQ